MKTILLIDDSQTSQDIIEESLKNTYNILKANNSIHSKGIISAHKDEIGLILMDVNMPGEDGFAFATDLKAGQYKDIPIIFLTVRDDKKDVVKGLRAGACDYITKPFNVEELKARIDIHIKD